MTSTFVDQFLAVRVESTASFSARSRSARENKSFDAAAAGRGNAASSSDSSHSGRLQY